MRRTVAAFALAALSLQAAHAAEVKGHNPNERTVLGFLETAFNERQPARAFERYVGATYRQHNPTVADGRDSAITAFNAFLPQFPGFHFAFKRVISSGNLVVVHSHVVMSQTDRGSAVVDIFRLERGKIVEHWDVSQPVPEQAANGNTMF